MLRDVPVQNPRRVARAGRASPGARTSGAKASPAFAAAGFTVLELLVVISVIALVAALILPAISSSRMTAGELRCQNNLRRLALATDLHEGTHGEYPSWMASTSPFYALLPFLEQKPLAEKLDPRRGAVPGEDLSIAPPVGVFLCPEDWAAERPELAATSYGYCMGSGVFREGSEGAFRAFGVGKRLIRDGLSSTAGLAEICPPGSDERTIWWIDMPGDYDPDATIERCPGAGRGTNDIVEYFRGGDWYRGSPVSIGYNHILPPGTRTCLQRLPGEKHTVSTGAASLNAGGPHRGRVFFSLLDGRVQSISESVDPATWRALGSAALDDIVAGDF